MKKMLYVTWLALTAAAAPLVAPAQSPPSTSSAESPAASIQSDMTQRYVHAKWTYPNADQMSNSYPGKAQDEHVSGQAKIVCAVDADGYLEKCAVLDEAPKGYEFGLATATQFVKYTHVDPKTVDGGIKAGDYKVFMYKWTLN